MTAPARVERSVQRRKSTPLDSVRDVFAERLDAIEQRIAALEASRRKRPRDDDDLDVIRALRVALDRASADAMSRVRFTATAVVEYARRVDPDLLAVLERADCTGARSLGKCFGRYAHTVIDGYQLVRLGLGNKGYIWKLVNV